MIQRGSPSYGSPPGTWMSQNIRPTPFSSGRHGRIAKVVGIRHRDHVGLLDRVEAGDRGAVEAHAALERVVELGGVDREALELPEDVGEPEADEAQVVLLDDPLDVVGRLRALVVRIRHQAPSLAPVTGGGEPIAARCPDASGGCAITYFP